MSQEGRTQIRTDQNRLAPETRNQQSGRATRSTDRPQERQAVDFMPQNDRERALYEMIRQLRAEVSNLRRQLEQNRGLRDTPRVSDSREQLQFDRGTREGGENRMIRDRDSGSREGGELSRSAERLRFQNAAQRDPNQQKTKKIFNAYDKNRDNVVSFEEWLAMREGEMTSERRAIEQKRFSEPAGDDQKITLEEFYRWTFRRSSGRLREDSGANRTGEREGAPRASSRAEDLPR